MGCHLPEESWWSRKEKFFWSHQYKKGKEGREWYLKHYPVCPGQQASTVHGEWSISTPILTTPPASFQVAMDSTANVLQDFQAPSRLALAFGTAKNRLTFVVLMKADAPQAVRSSMYMGMRQQGLKQTPKNFKVMVNEQVDA